MTPGSLSFAKLVMMSFAPAKSAGDTRYASQDPFIHSTLSHTISTPICIRSAFFLPRTQIVTRTINEFVTMSVRVLLSMNLNVFELLTKKSFLQ